MHVLLCVSKTRCELYRWESSRSWLLFLSLQLLAASLLSSVMRSPILHKFCVAFLFLNSREVELLSLQFHFLVLWLCRKFNHVFLNQLLVDQFFNSYLYWYLFACRHNLFLHSALVLSRKIPRSVYGIKVIILFEGSNFEFLFQYKQEYYDYTHFTGINPRIFVESLT